MYFPLLKVLWILTIVQNVSPTLNNIIKLSDGNFTYNHISINSKGDMIIDTSSSESGERKFYGIKKNGAPYFETSYYKIMFVGRVEHPGRSEGEALFIKYKKNQENSEIGECLVYIPEKGNKYMEYYFFDDNDTVSKEVNSYNFESIKSKRFSALKFQSDNDTDFDYIFCYNKNNKTLMIFQGYFDQSKEYLYNEYNSSIVYKNLNNNIERMVSCFFTNNKKYICFFYYSSAYRIISFLFKGKKIDKKFETTINNNAYFNYNIFYKAIHVKNEIGAFIYFNKVSNKYPQIEFKRIGESSLENTIGPININRYIFCKEESLNDFIKLNDDQVCYISTSLDKTNLYIVILTLYNLDTDYFVKYFSQNMNKYNICFNKQIISNLYNGFITIVFSHSIIAPTVVSSSFLILGYANSTDNTINIIEKIKEEGKSIDNLCLYLNSNLTIDNNILNYSFNGTQIIDYSREIELFVDNNPIEKYFTLAEDKCIKISFPNENGIFRANTYKIEFVYIVKESMNETFANYEEKTFKGKHSNFSFVLENDIYCKNDNCFLCNDSLTRLTGNDDIDFNEIKNRCNITIQETEFIPIATTQSIIEKSEINNKNIQNSIKDFDFQTEILIKNISNCSLDDMIEQKCSTKINKDQISEMYDKIKGKIKSNKSLIISTEKLTFQISTLKEQKSNNPNISSIDLGKCEQIIKDERGLSDEDDLLIYKMDIKSDDLSTTYVQYEIYDPKTYDYINLDICEGIFINIYSPVTLKDSTETLYQSMSNSGYNLFNLNDSFYNDICSTYTTQDGTDLTLLDRKNIIYDKNANISICQEGCQLINYNSTLKKANCDCKIQTENIKTNIETITFNSKDIASSFFKTLTNSNFLVLKCFKLVFSQKGQKNNIGSWTMSILTLLFLIFLFFFIFKERKKIIMYIQLILEQKLFSQKSDNRVNYIFNVDKSKNMNNNKKNKDKKENEFKKQKNKKEKKEQFTNNKNSNKKKYKAKNFPPKKSKKKGELQNSFLSANKYQNSQSTKTNKINFLLIEQNKNSKNKNQKNVKFAGQSTILSKQSKEVLKLDKNNNANNELNDEELNGLEYEVAIELDKRTYFQYYIALIKKKHLILFAFLPNNDYNLISVKISLLILAFSLYFTINGFFFSDKTMNKINEDKGAFNFLFQIPQILYSTLICAVINLILKRLSLSEKQIIIIKQEAIYKKAENKSKKIKTCLMIKLAIFFLISFLFMAFFWYFVSCFCAVYKNTQIILIKDTLISIALSMIYPFGLNLLPGFFRIPALRAKDKDKKYLYILSGYIALI